MNALDWFVRGFIFVTGAVIGSFLNVCIVRLPRNQSIVKPRSHCVVCKKTIAWFDNIPLLSFLVLRGKCRHCATPISVRYFIVELTTALGFVLFYEWFGLNPVLLPYLAMFCGFMITTFVDLEHRIIPDEVSVGGLWVGLAFSAITPGLHEAQADSASISTGTVLMIILVLACLLMQGLTAVLQKLGHKIDRQDEEEADDGNNFGFYLLIAASAGAVLLINVLGARWTAPSMQPLMSHLRSFENGLIGYIIGGGCIYAMGMLGDIIFRKESMGGGDIKLMAMIGAFLGWKLAILSFFIAPLFGALSGIVVKLRTKESVIAYGPFIVMGALISLFWGYRLIDWILSGYGFRY